MFPRINHYTILFLLGYLVSIGIGQTINVSGFVFWDENHNLQRDVGETGIEGVLVSNQLEVVQTDKNGRYSLSMNNGEVLFITKPANYTLPLSSTYLPRFYYAHSKNGSPDFEYKGLDPTGDLPDEINFPLYKSLPEDSFSVIVFSDPQPRNRQEIDYIRDDVVTEIMGTNSVFGIVLGDIMYNDLSLNESYTEVISQIEIPFYHVPGNHDMNFDAENDQYSLETFKRVYGPSYYGFEYGKVHFIVLDDVEYLGYNEEGSPHYQGNLGERQLQWLSNYIPKIPDDRLLVLNMHIPFYSIAGEHPSIRVADRTKIFKLLENRRHLLALAGHMHTIEHQFLGPDQDWHGSEPFHQIICGAVSGSWWSGPPDARGIPVADQRDGTPNGYHIFTFTGNTYKEKYKSANFGADHQMRISWPEGSVKRENLQDTLIIVNVFDGSEKTVVECRIDKGPALVMSREIRRDPFFEKFHENNQEFYADWIRPVKSNHIWTAPIPENLEPGIHRISVTTRNQWGDIYRTNRLFEIVD